MANAFGGEDGAGLTGQRIEIVGPLKRYKPDKGAAFPEIVIRRVEQVRVLD